MAATAGADLLALLPSEIILNILEFAPPPTLASLTRASKAWHQFIDVDHQDAIYSSTRKTDHPRGAKNFDFLSSQTSFSKYFDSVSSWKELCKRQTLLSRSWAAVEPETRESILQVGRNRVWRFKPDFKRRFFLSTSHDGGVQVTDMNTGHMIWSLPKEDVRPFAHLEYQDGTAIWDRYGNALEVWKTDFPDGVRGEFRRVAVINHECETRGFQMAHNTLVVSSSEGEGFAYDMLQTPPVLKTHVTLPEGAMGHVYQDEDAILFSMAERGFYFYEKATGEFLGYLDGIGCRKYRHIKHPPVRSPSLFDRDRFEPRRPAFPPSNPRKDRLTPLDLDFGPLSGVIQVPIEEDDWGAGMIDGGLFVGVSRGGRILICPQWRQALKDKQDPTITPNWTVIECEDNGAGFDIGGWLAIKDNRFLCEMSGRIHIISLNDDGDVFESKPERASWSLSTASSSELKVPVSFMGLYDDCIMSTFSTLGWEAEDENLPRPLNRIFPTKAIRILSFSPDADGTRNEGLWQDPDIQQIAAADGRALGQFMDLIAILGGHIEGVDGDELVLEEQEDDDSDDEDYEEEDENEAEEEDEEMADLISLDEGDGGELFQEAGHELGDDDDEMPELVGNNAGNDNA